MVAQAAWGVACRTIWACKAHGCYAAHRRLRNGGDANTAHRKALRDKKN